MFRSLVRVSLFMIICYAGRLMFDSQQQASAPRTSREVPSTGFQIHTSPLLSDGGGKMTVATVDTRQEDSNCSLSHGRGAEAFVNTLHAIFPPPSKFENKFRNPCWYVHITIPSHIKTLIQKIDTQTSSRHSHILLTKAALQKKLVCIPKVYMIGFPRTSSTHLYELLVRHPEVVPGLYKEPHWWTRLPFRAEFPHNILSILHYVMHYYPATKYIQNHPHALTIDASQTTVWDMRKLCKTPDVIHSVIPQAKYIMLMRDPVSRLFSDYAYLCQHVWINGEVRYTYINPHFRNNGSKLFHQAVLKELQNFKQCMRSKTLEVCTHDALLAVSNQDSATCGRVRLVLSLYHVHVSRWLKVIPRDQFLFLRTEDLAADPYAVLQKVWQFLELPVQSQDDLTSILYEHSNSNQLTSVEINPETRKILEQFFQPHNEKLAHLLSDEKFLWKDLESSV